MREEIAMQFHPRAFAAFGSDLVTNDMVAVTELVKNCYDAFANNVALCFGKDDLHGDYIEILDDGLGMTQEIIKNAWSVIATPYKKNNPVVERNGKIRMVSGNKGLGRFSASRLGMSMQIITHNESGNCFSADIDWDAFLNSDSIADCKVILGDHPLEDLLSRLNSCFHTDSKTGTIIRIYRLAEKWDDEKIASLKQSLARLITPFVEVRDFSIYLYKEGNNDQIKIEPHEFIQNPVYCIRGNISDQGTVNWNFTYAPKGRVTSTEQGTIDWDTASNGFDRFFQAVCVTDNEEVVSYCAGPFSFEIRVWDLDKESIADIHESFNVQRQEIRKTISLYKGISVYRDNVLVLPKSDSSKDWLGVDIRRVSALGKRLSTSQMVGIFSISSDNNPGLKDTTDREKLVDTTEYKQFCRIAETIVLTLENLRNVYKKNDARVEAPTLTDLLAPLSAASLESKVELLVQEGKDSIEILNAVQEYSADIDKNLNELNERLVYYAQTASLGSIAIVIMHEIRSGMNVIKRFLNQIGITGDITEKRTAEYYDDAGLSHQRLLDVANSFAPLYKKDIYKEKNSVDVKEAIAQSIRLVSAKKEARKVQFNVDINEAYTAQMHTGELQTVIINLLDNSCYWLQKNKTDKVIHIHSKKVADNRVELIVSDNGPGINLESKEKIFQPGITAKPHGIGMGLVIVTELLNNHGGSIRLETPGELDGATFVFDIPLV